MIKAFNGIHGKIAIALGGLAAALAVSVCAAWAAGSATAPPAATSQASGAAPAWLPVMAFPGLAGAERSAGSAPSAARAGRGAVFADAAEVRGVTMQSGLASARGGRSPRQFARWLLVHRFHWRRWQFKYLNRLWDRESGWNSRASNPYSGAYGIPQAVPGVKMASAGPDWRWSARTQIRWGMRYVQDRYRTPYWAWRHECGYGWY